MNRLLLGLSLEVKDTGRLGFDHAIDLPQHGIAHDNGAGYGLDLQPRREIDDVAMRGDTRALAAVYCPEHDGARREADTKLWTMAKFCLDPVGSIREPLLNLECRPARPQWPVFERGRCSEQGQDAVAGEILHGARVTVDGGGGEA